MLPRLLNFFFHLLYHSFAWSYDLVAWAVSFGKWKQWVYAILPMIEGRRVLEMGSGPGHLMVRLEQEGYQVYAIDESRQMVRQSTRRFRKQFDASPRLARALGQELPFPCAAFDTVVATFPAPYIGQPETLAEIRRVLKPDGRLLILLAAWITGTSLPDRLLAWLFRVTGETPRLDDERAQRFQRFFAEAGFNAEQRWIELPATRLLLIFAKPEKRS